MFHYADSFRIRCIPVFFHNPRTTPALGYCCNIVSYGKMRPSDSCIVINKSRKCPGSFTCTPTYLFYTVCLSGTNLLFTYTSSVTIRLKLLQVVFDDTSALLFLLNWIVTSSRGHILSSWICLTSFHAECPSTNSLRSGLC